MAIFRAETKHISRGKNHNVVAAAAYRSGEKLTDTNKFNPDAKTHDYTKKTGVLASGIILPTSLIEQDFTIDRQQLWSSVEQSETTTRSVKGSRLKQTARLAREWLLALPHELSNDENENLTREFTERLVNDLGVIADYAIHEPTQANYQPKKDFINRYDPDTHTSENVAVDDIEPTAPDSRNIHAHIMFTTRKAELDKSKSLVFGDKADSERSEKWRQEQKLSNGGDYLKEIRQLWADMINRRLKQKNILPISAKSYQDLGLNIIPQHKQGKNASVMALYGFTPPTIGLNNDIKRRNDAYLESTADSCIATEPQESKFGDKRARAAADSIASAGEWLSTANPILERRAKQRARITSARDSGFAGLNKQTILFDRLTERTDSLIAQHLSPKAPSPYSVANRVIDTEQCIKDTKLATFITNQDLGGLSKRVDLICDKRAAAISNRFFRNYYLFHHRGIMKFTKEDLDKRLDARQQEILNQFSVQHQLIPENEYSVQEYRGQLSAFFKDTGNLKEHQKFISMLFNPKAEQLEYDRMTSDAHQETLNHDSYLSTKNDTKDSKEAQQEPPVPQNRPRFR